MRRGFRGLFLVLGVVACAPSRESMTAGQIGCPPNEITIGNEDSSIGFGQGSETWTAECQGRIFVCTKLTTGGENAADSDVSCREELGSEKQQATSPADSSAKTAPTEAKAAGAPTGGAGFELGATSEAAQKACEGAGNTWEASGAIATCSGPATNVGFEVGVTFDLCRDHVCKITVAHSPKSKWASAFAELKTKLIEKYGAPADSSTNVPPSCRAEPDLIACFDRGLRLRLDWSWKTGETLRLSAGKPEKSGGPAAIRLEYARPESALGADSSAL
ncbi:MAG TPA: hypothetical protein VMS65_10095 [Polyangiaceae bacterium]|nr:hypothetical protein [Polyangiaceae bacterium]